MLADRRLHTTLPTLDPARLRTFYEETLGLRPFAERPGAILYRAGEGSLFAISKAGARATGGHTQMVFTVPDVAAELRARGVEFEEFETPKTEQGHRARRCGSGGLVHGSRRQSGWPAVR
jgi:catechol 2,3-dioxygenase-like lactoylglutathione lyase family enzyme